MRITGRAAHLGVLLEETLMTSSYGEVYKSWQEDPEGFWMDQASAIDWFTKPATAFDPDLGV